MHAHAMQSPVNRPTPKTVHHRDIYRLRGIVILERGRDSSETALDGTRNKGVETMHLLEMPSKLNLKTLFEREKE